MVPVDPQGVGAYYGLGVAADPTDDRGRGFERAAVTTTGQCLTVLPACPVPRPGFLNVPRVRLGTLYRSAVGRG